MAGGIRNLLPGGFYHRHYNSLSYTPWILQSDIYVDRLVGVDLDYCGLGIIDSAELVLGERFTV
jgi:hypothetical protein